MGKLVERNNAGHRWKVVSGKQGVDWQQHRPATQGENAGGSKTTYLKKIFPSMPLDSLEGSGGRMGGGGARHLK